MLRRRLSGLFSSALAVVALLGSVGAAGGVKLGFWTSVPICSGGVCGTGTSCLPGTLAAVREHRELIDRLIVGSGLAVTVAGDVVCTDCGKEYGLEDNIQSWLPELKAALQGSPTDIILSLDIGWDGAGHAWNESVSGLRGALANADAVAAALTRLALTHGFAGYDIDVEAECCKPVGANHCACDDAFSEALATLFATLARSVHAHGKTLSMDANEHGSGYLRMHDYGRYLGAGVDRLRQMGTYGLTNRSGITQALLAGYPMDRIAFGTCTLERYGQNTSTLESWLRELTAAHQRINASAELEVDVFMLQGGLQRTDRTGATPGSAASPQEDWWPLLRRFRQGLLKTDELLNPGELAVEGNSYPWAAADAN